MFLVGYSGERIRMHCTAILAALFGVFQYMPRLAPALAFAGLCGSLGGMVARDLFQHVPGRDARRPNAKNPAGMTDGASMVFWVVTALMR